MPDSATLYNEAEKLKDEGKYDEAIAKCQEILKADEQYTMAHLMLAVVFGKVGKHDEAVQHGQRACELEPNDPFSFTAMSVTYQRAFAGTQNHAFIQKAEDAMAKAHTLQGRH